MVTISASEGQSIDDAIAGWGEIQYSIRGGIWQSPGSFAIGRKVDAVTRSSFHIKFVYGTVCALFFQWTETEGQSIRTKDTTITEPIASNYFICRLLEIEVSSVDHALVALISSTRNQSGPHFHRFFSSSASFGIFYLDPIHPVVMGIVQLSLVFPLLDRYRFVDAMVRSRWPISGH